MVCYDCDSSIIESNEWHSFCFVSLFHGTELVGSFDGGSM